MTVDELLALYSPVTFYATDRGVRLDYGYRSFPGATVQECIDAFVQNMQKPKPDMKIKR